MRIIYLADQYKPKFYSGTIKFIENITQFMHRNGHEVFIISYSFDEKESYDQVLNNICYRKEVIDNITVIKIRKNNETDNIHFELYDEDLYQFGLFLINDLKPDMIHVCHSRRVAPLVFSAIKLKVPYLFTFTDSYLMCSNLFLYDTKFNLCSGPLGGVNCKKNCGEFRIDFEKRDKQSLDLINNANYLIAPSRFQALLYEKYFGKEVNIIPHGNRLEHVEKNDKKYNKNANLTFIFNGGNHYMKGIYVLIDAFNQLTDCPDIKLRIYGENNNNDVFTMMLQNKNVKFCGTYDNNELSNIYRNVDVLICPSICFENYPFSITEAFVYNVPVIASNIGGMAEIVKTGINGFTFDVENSHQLAEIIRLIAKNPEILNHLKHNISMQKNRGITEETNDYLNIYHRIKENPSLKVKNVKFSPKNKYSRVVEQYMKNKNIISEFDWDCIYSDVSNKFVIRDDFFEVMKIRIYYLLEKFSGKKVKYLIWGTGNSGKITRFIFDKTLPNFELVGFVDPYRNGKVDGVIVYNQSELKGMDYDYLIICTTPGRKFAEDFMNDNLNCRILNDYIYGYGFI